MFLYVVTLKLSLQSANKKCTKMDLAFDVMEWYGHLEYDVHS